MLYIVQVWVGREMDNIYFVDKILCSDKSGLLNVSVYLQDSDLFGRQYYLFGLQLFVMYIYSIYLVYSIFSIYLVIFSF